MSRSAPATPAFLLPVAAAAPVVPLLAPVCRRPRGPGPERELRAGHGFLSFTPVCGRNLANVLLTRVKGSYVASDVQAGRRTLHLRVSWDERAAGRQGHSANAPSRGAPSQGPWPCSAARGRPRGPTVQRAAVFAGSGALGLPCARCRISQSGLLVPQGPATPSSSDSFAMMTFTQETPSSCIKTLTLAWGSGTLSLNWKLRWPACLLQWIAKSQVRVCVCGGGACALLTGKSVCVERVCFITGSVPFVLHVFFDAQSCNVSLENLGLQ